MKRKIFEVVVSGLLFAVIVKTFEKNFLPLNFKMDFVYFVTIIAFGYKFLELIVSTISYFIFNGRESEEERK